MKILSGVWVFQERGTENKEIKIKNCHKVLHFSVKTCVCEILMPLDFNKVKLQNCESQQERSCHKEFT
jgi:hypothetical protein